MVKYKVYWKQVIPWVDHQTLETVIKFWVDFCTRNACHVDLYITDYMPHIAIHHLSPVSLLP